MRTVIRTCILGCVALLAGVPSAVAQPARRVSLTVKVALDPSIGGTVVSAGSATILGVPAAITETKWTDTNSNSSPLGAFDVGYAVAPRVEVLGGLEFGKARTTSSVVTIGSVPSGPLTASFDAYSYWGLEAGVRAGLQHGHGAYAVVTGGFRRVSDISAILSAPTYATSVPIYEGSAVPSFGFGGGFIFGGEGFGVGLEIGVKYAGSLKPAASSGLSGVNDAGARWSLPLGLVLRF